MTTTINQLEKAFINSLETILNNIDIETIDEILDNRDEETFSDVWTNAYEETKHFTIEPKLKTEIDRIRENIFKTVFQKTNSSDLSAYISDDFDLIALHLLADSKNNWIVALQETYLKNEIPQ